MNAMERQLEREKDARRSATFEEESLILNWADEAVLWTSKDKKKSPKFVQTASRLANDTSDILTSAPSSSLSNSPFLSTSSSYNYLPPINFSPSKFGPPKHLANTTGIKHGANFKRRQLARIERRSLRLFKKHNVEIVITDSSDDPQLLHEFMGEIDEGNHSFSELINRMTTASPTSTRKNARPTRTSQDSLLSATDSAQSLAFDADAGSEKPEEDVTELELEEQGEHLMMQNGRVIIKTPSFIRNSTGSIIAPKLNEKELAEDDDVSEGSDYEYEHHNNISSRFSTATDHIIDEEESDSDASSLSSVSTAASFDDGDLVQAHQARGRRGTDLSVVIEVVEPIEVAFANQVAREAMDVPLPLSPLDGVFNFSPETQASSKEGAELPALPSPVAQKRIPVPPLSGLIVNSSEDDTRAAALEESCKPHGDDRVLVLNCEELAALKRIPTLPKHRVTSLILPPSPEQGVLTLNFVDVAIATPLPLSPVVVESLSLPAARLASVPTSLPSPPATLVAIVAVEPVDSTTPIDDSGRSSLIGTPTRPFSVLSESKRDSRISMKGVGSTSVDVANEFQPIFAVLAGLAEAQTPAHVSGDDELETRKFDGQDADGEDSDDSKEIQITLIKPLAIDTVLSNQAPPQTPGNLSAQNYLSLSPTMSASPTSSISSSQSRGFRQRSMSFLRRLSGQTITFGSTEDEFDTPTTSVSTTAVSTPVAGDFKSDDVTEQLSNRLSIVSDRSVLTGDSENVGSRDRMLSTSPSLVSIESLMSNTDDQYFEDAADEFEVNVIVEVGTELGMISPRLDAVESESESEIGSDIDGELTRSLLNLSPSSSFTSSKRTLVISPAILGPEGRVEVAPAARPSRLRQTASQRFPIPPFDLSKLKTSKSVVNHIDSDAIFGSPSPTIDESKLNEEMAMKLEEEVVKDLPVPPITPRRVYALPSLPPASPVPILKVVVQRKLFSDSLHQAMESVEVSEKTPARVEVAVVINEKRASIYFAAPNFAIVTVDTTRSPILLVSGEEVETIPVVDVEEMSMIVDTSAGTSASEKGKGREVLEEDRLEIIMDGQDQSSILNSSIHSRANSIMSDQDDGDYPSRARRNSFGYSIKRRFGSVNWGSSTSSFGSMESRSTISTNYENKLPESTSSKSSRFKLSKSTSFNSLLSLNTSSLTGRKVYSAGEQGGVRPSRSFTDFKFLTTSLRKSISRKPSSSLSDLTSTSNISYPIQLNAPGSTPSSSTRSLSKTLGFTQDIRSRKISLPIETTGTTLLTTVASKKPKPKKSSNSKRYTLLPISSPFSSALSYKQRISPPTPLVSPTGSIFKSTATKKSPSTTTSNSVFDVFSDLFTKFGKPIVIISANSNSSSTRFHPKQFPQHERNSSGNQQFRYYQS